MKNGQKNGIYVNHNGSGEITVTFRNITTEGNAWAGIGLVAQNEGAVLKAIFEGNNSFGENPGVYSEQGVSAENPNSYKGTVNVTGLDEYQHPSKPTFQKAYKVSE